MQFQFVYWELQYGHIVITKSLNEKKYYANKLAMTAQYIKENLDKLRSWYIVLTKPHSEQKTKIILEKQGIITYLPFTSIRRQWKVSTKKIHIPAMARCVFIYATNEEIQILKKQYPVLPPEVIVR